MMVILERGRQRWGGIGTKEVRADRGMVVGGNVEKGWFDNFSSKSTYM
jgi:hypothetical protein